MKRSSYWSCFNYWWCFRNWSCWRYIFSCFNSKRRTPIKWWKNYYRNFWFNSTRKKIKLDELNLVTNITVLDINSETIIDDILDGVIDQNSSAILDRTQLTVRQENNDFFLEPNNDQSKYSGSIKLNVTEADQETNKLSIFSYSIISDKYSN
ncbi:hypothetical protein [Mesoplasma grammopterae]|uniref:hypothetical protein n=1 Tax=Mesoplasma grammopterae TaxID=217215 RepID=UPI0012EB249B|nr:hypothetical protein [Mesoplasma grammopterae]